MDRLNKFISIKPLLILGPCSAESFDLLDGIVRELKKCNLNFILRAGVWKNRTNIKSFEGYGEIALQWLQQIKKIYQLFVATEVIMPQHIEMCAKYNIDVIWLGTRTVVNPFLVKELALSLKDYSDNFFVFIKNPILPDINLWISAIERFLSLGIENIGLIHRGFFINRTLKYRNAPYWNLAKKIKKLFPNLLILCDPSHIAGNRKYIKKIINEAKKINFDGYMIECHINPKQALSDNKQQITPLYLYRILKKTVLE